MFRVVLGKVMDQQAYIAGSVESDSMLPCGRTVTGYWSLDARHTVNLLRAIESDMMAQFGGGCWPTELAVLIAPDEGYEEVAPHPTYQERFDGSEVFVKEVPPNMTWVWWEEFLKKERNV